MDTTERRGPRAGDTPPAATPATAPWGVLTTIDLDGCAPGRLAADHVCRLVPALLRALGSTPCGALAVHASGPAGARQLVLTQAVEDGSVTVHVDVAGRRCLVDLLLRRSVDAAAAGELAAGWLDGAPTVSVLARGVAARQAP